jgi:polysaccharide export outer membrane protein
MAKKQPKAVFSSGLLLLLGAALLPPMMTAPVVAQVGASTTSLSTAGMASSAGKANVSSPGLGPVVVPKDLSSLRIAPGDLLNVSVYDAPEFTNAYRVDPAGDLTLPLCGKVNILGLTMQDAAKRLEAALKDGQILLQPQVNVDVVQYAGQYVTVMGEVVNPGRMPLIAPTMLGEILAEAGGVTPLAGARIKIRRGANDAVPEEEVSYSRSQNSRETASILVRPGDSVIVPRAGIIYVLGAVNKPGGYVMQEDGQLNVAQALALSGGTVLQANTGGLRVIRRNPDGTVLDFPLSYSAITQGTQTPLLLQAQDIVYVPMSKIKATFSTATGIISAAASAAIIHQ